MIVGNPVSSKDAHGYKEQIKHQLYQKGVSEKKTVILVIDEGQKLPVFCLEILREFLNYETNDHKLLQIVLFAQEEIQDILRSSCQSGRSGKPDPFSGADEPCRHPPDDPFSHQTSQQPTPAASSVHRVWPCVPFTVRRAATPERSLICATSAYWQ
jgi:hypothetical protein